MLISPYFPYTLTEDDTSEYVCLPNALIILSSPLKALSEYNMLIAVIVHNASAITIAIF